MLMVYSVEITLQLYFHLQRVSDRPLLCGRTQQQTHYRRKVCRYSVPLFWKSYRGKGRGLQPLNGGSYDLLF